MKLIIILSCLILCATGAFANSNTESKVFFTKDISPAGLKKAYEALGRKATGKIAVKISTGEPGGHNYLKPELIGDLVKSVNGTIVECNTAYGGRRADSESHMKAAEEHGFTKIAKVDIMDANGEIELPVRNGFHLKGDLVGENFKNYDFYVILSHFKGHAMAGFGGALKNISIGIGSSAGKARIHSAGKTDDPGKLWSNLAEQKDFLESMADASSAVIDAVGDNILYINVLNRLSVDCDCDSNPAEPDMHDIGIMASLDPVALDRASVDQIYAAPDGKSLIERMETRLGTHTIDSAEKLGLGTTKYTIIDLDK